MKNLLDIYKSMALSNFDLIKLVGGNANVEVYPEIHKYDTIDELLGPHDACFLLFETEPKFGHWCAIIKYGNTVEFFDPYSGYPDNVLEFIPEDFKNESNQNYPYLTELLYECPYDIEFNDHKYQKKSNKINTCGRHCACRILFKNLDLKEYDSMIKTLSKNLKTDPDGVVTTITAELSEGKI